MTALLNTAAWAQDQMKWSVESFKEEGKSVTVLSRGVPETDNVKMYAACVAGEPVELVISADVGKRKNGTAASLRFSSNGDRFNIRGQVVGVGNTEEAIAGIRAELAKTSPLWGAMAASEKLTYQIGKGNAGSLALSDGQRSISEFLSKCGISPASGQPQTASAPTTGSGDSQSATNSTPSGGTPSDAPKREIAQNRTGGGSISEKEAFESAKELGTIEGWEAFLNRFSTGFRADLARAYVKRLASSEGPKRAAGADKPDADRRPEPPPEETQPLEPVAHEPGITPWTNSNQRMELADNKSVYTASVKAGGLELVTFCMDNKAFGGSGKGLGATIRQLDDGAYRRFDDRVEQGLRNSRELGDGPEREILIEFDNGERVNRAAAQPDPIAGSLFFGPRGRTFTANSSGLANLLSGNTVTVELDPFRATFQLKNSRNAICKVMNRCGARVPGCGRGTSGRDRGERYDRDFVEPPTFIYQPGPRRRCSGGRYFSRRAQACVCPASRPRWNGRRCRPARIIRQCGPNRRWSAARRRCVPIVRQCGPGRRWAVGQQRCVCIAPRTRWNGRRCVQIRPNCRPGTIPNAQGRCVPIVRHRAPVWTGPSLGSSSTTLSLHRATHTLEWTTLRRDPPELQTRHETGRARALCAHRPPMWPRTPLEWPGLCASPSKLPTRYGPQPAWAMRLPWQSGVEWPGLR